MKTKAAVGALVIIVVVSALFLSYASTKPAADLSSTPEGVRLPASPQLTQSKNPTLEATLRPQPLLTSSTTSPTSVTAPEASPSATAHQQQLFSTPELSTPEPSLPVTSLSPAGPTPQPTEGIVGKPPTPAGRVAPDAAAGPLTFQQIRVFQNVSTGTFSMRANMTNTGPQFLNALTVSWQILDGANQILDHGQFNWPNLAPGETATVSFDGSTAFADSWVRLNFEYTP